mgnify:FL=1
MLKLEDLPVPEEIPLPKEDTGEKEEQGKGKEREKHLDEEPPEEFLCPITTTLMEGKQLPLA